MYKWHEMEISKYHIYLYLKQLQFIILSFAKWERYGSIGPCLEHFALLPSTRPDPVSMLNPTFISTTMLDLVWSKSTLVDGCFLNLHFDKIEEKLEVCIVLSLLLTVNRPSLYNPPCVST